jgi:hypothetical protein
VVAGAVVAETVVAGVVVTVAVVAGKVIAGAVIAGAVVAGAVVAGVVVSSMATFRNGKRLFYLLQPRQPRWLTSVAASGANMKVPAPDPHTQMPKTKHRIARIDGISDD